MMRALWAAASGMIAQQLNVDTIAHNLANVNTAGFKRSRVDFQDVLRASALVQHIDILGDNRLDKTKNL